MTTDTRTTNQNYPKPYPSNLLAADVVRLREALDAIDSDIAARPTSASITADIATAVNDLIAGSPTALDTLNELAAALGNDAAFSTTVTTALGARLQLAGGTMTGPLTLSGDPTQALQPSTKQYTDQQITQNAGASIGLAIALG